MPAIVSQFVIPTKEESKADASFLSMTKQTGYRASRFYSSRGMILCNQEIVAKNVLAGNTTYLPLLYDSDG